jgi:putative PIN family toxin of toxin-antitoxin system
MPAVVLVDTNVWVSAFINPHRFPAKLRDAWIAQRFQVVVSASLLDEIAEVLARPRIRNKYRISSEEIAEFLRLLSAQAIGVVTTGQLHLCRDPDDDLILETALLGQAQYAVSRDDDIKRDQDLIAHMQAHGVTVLSVQLFVERLDGGGL